MSILKKTIQQEEWRLHCVFQKVDVFNGNGNLEMLDKIIEIEEKCAGEYVGDVDEEQFRNKRQFVQTYLECYFGNMEIVIDLQSWVPEIRVIGI